MNQTLALPPNEPLSQSDGSECEAFKGERISSFVGKNVIIVVVLKGAFGK